LFDPGQYKFPGDLKRLREQKKWQWVGYMFGSQFL
jgi:hypothetical protein